MESPLRLRLEYLPPQQPSPGSIDWDEALDYPGIRAFVSLPNQPGTGQIRSDLVANQIECCGANLTEYWGTYDGRASYRTKDFRAPTLLFAEQQARDWHAEGVKVLEAVIKERAPRYARRLQIIETAHAICGEVKPDPKVRF